MKKIRMTVASIAVALATVLTVGLAAAPGDAVVRADQPFGCC